MAGAGTAAARVVSHQDLRIHLLFHPAASRTAASALRPVDVLGMEGHAAARARKSLDHRRRGFGLEKMMFSLLETIWRVFLHMFRKRVTVQYPDEKPYLPPRWRGRIILSR